MRYMKWMWNACISCTKHGYVHRECKGTARPSQEVPHELRLGMEIGIGIGRQTSKSAHSNIKQKHINRACFLWTCAMHMRQMARSRTTMEILWVQWVSPLPTPRSKECRALFSYSNEGNRKSTRKEPEQTLEHRCNNSKSVYYTLAEVDVIRFALPFFSMAH